MSLAEYNDRSELKRYRSYRMSSIEGAVHDPLSVPGRHHSYDYDGAGNRVSYGVNTATSNLWGQQTTYEERSGADWIARFEREYLARLTPEVRRYDGRGNLVEDGEWHYHYDAENRLVEMERRAEIRAAGSPRLKLRFAYDYLHRRIAKTVYSHYDGMEYTQEATTFYGYVGTRLALEMDGDGEVLRKYFWRSGAAQAGGLLMSVDYTDGVNYAYPAYDGGGNVVGWFDPATNSAEGFYEYSPYGETLRASGPIERMPFRHGTQYHDVETGLYSYLFRYYDPGTARWLNRDPIGHDGGFNLYAYVGNNPLNMIDLLGLCGSDNNSGEGMNAGSFEVPRIEPRVDIGGVSMTIQEYRDMQTWTEDAAFLGFGDVPRGKALATQAVMGSQHNFRWGSDYLDWPQRSPAEPEANLQNPHQVHETNSLPDAPVYQRAGSSLGNALSRIPILGYVLGPVGDIASGAGNIFSGNFGAGLSQIGYGVGDFAAATITDAVDFAVGITVGKMYAIGESIRNRSIGQFMASVIIPHHGAMTGANWGYNTIGHDNRSLVLRWNRLD